jgi:hypothetical protein
MRLRTAALLYNSTTPPFTEQRNLMKQTCTPMLARVTLGVELRNLAAHLFP